MSDFLEFRLLKYIVAVAETRQHIVKCLPIGEYAVILPRKLMDLSSYSGIAKLSEVLRSHLNPNDLCCLLFQLPPAEYP